MRRRGLFLKAYAKIYANAGATTVGTDPQDTIQGMSVARIDEIIAQLRNGTYQWKPSRRVYVPKHNGSQRPISIPNWSDKLVQEVMRMILEAYYEPQFRDSSHGFRPNRGCHTALQEIKRKWTGTKWFIEGDIKGCFDNLSFEVIVSLLSRNMHDNRFLKLVKDMLRVGYVDDWQYHQTQSGAPQGGIVSPIISNIVLHELDSYVEDVLIPQHTAGKRRRHNREYYRLSREKLRAKQSGDKSLYRDLSKQQRNLPEGDPNDPGFKRLRYIRYCDDFLLGVIGTKEDARNIKAQAAAHLRSLELTLSQEKTYITHARTEAARFLGYEISTAQANSKITKGTDNVKRRSVNGVIQFRVPRSVKTKWIGRYTRHGKPHQIGGYIELTDYEIVETFGAQLRGLTNFYSLADGLSVSPIRQVRWVCMESARKTLAAKHKIRKPSVTYRRYYRNGATSNEWRHLQVTVERDGKTPLVAKCGETPLRTRKTSYISDIIPPKVVAGTTSELLTRLLAGKCELCECMANLEAHHLNKLKNLRKRWQGVQDKPKWVQHMIARRRKTIVVCHACHQQITHGRYDGQQVNW
jgi:group II intron reverse transcriptase/maturase